MLAHKTLGLWKSNSKWDKRCLPKSGIELLCRSKWDIWCLFSTRTDVGDFFMAGRKITVIEFNMYCIQRILVRKLKSNTNLLVNRIDIFSYCYKYKLIYCTACLGCCSSETFFKDFNVALPSTSGTANQLELVTVRKNVNPI